MRAENGDPVWPVSRQAISVGRTTNLLRLGSSASPAHSRIPLPSHGTDNRKWYKRSTEAANKCSRREKFLALRPLHSCRERKRERADRFDAPLKVNNRLETSATTPIFFPKRDEIFSSQLLLSPRSFPARKRETRDSLYRVLYRFLHQLSRSNRFFIQFMYASHHFKAQVWKFGDARERDRESYNDSKNEDGYYLNLCPKQIYLFLPSIFGYILGFSVYASRGEISDKVDHR